MLQDEYDVAQICLNGHVICDSINNLPEHTADYCQFCGEKSITECPNCKTRIRGFFWGEGAMSTGEYIPPSYCNTCGKPFPWIDTKINIAIELSKELGGLSDNDALELKQNIKDIVTDSPKTQLGAIKFKKVMTKVGKETTSAIRDIIVDIVSETAKKIIWGK